MDGNKLDEIVLRITGILDFVALLLADFKNPDGLAVASVRDVGFDKLERVLPASNFTLLPTITGVQLDEAELAGWLCFRGKPLSKPS